MKQNINQDTGLPALWYVDPLHYVLEREVFFEQAINYVGHELMVPNLNDFFVLDNQAEILVHNEEGFVLLSNICRHHQALMLHGQGNVEKIICPVHRWCYSNKGELLNAPLFSKELNLNLPKQSLKNWKGLLFAGKSNLPSFNTDSKLLHYLTFDDYVYTNTTIEHYAFNWKIFIDVYLDNYHINPFHPGLRSLVDCQNLQWDSNAYFSAQMAGLSKNFLHSQSASYQDWQQALMDYRKGVEPEFGAIWFLLYPNVMIELYSEMLVISTIKPHGPDKCINTVDYFYPHALVKNYPEIVSLSQRSYQETAQEDEEICQRIFKGKQLLCERGLDDAGPYAIPTEQGVPLFHQYVVGQLAEHM